MLAIIMGVAPKNAPVFQAMEGVGLPSVALTKWSEITVGKLLQHDPYDGVRAPVWPGTVRSAQPTSQIHITSIATL